MSDIRPKKLIYGEKRGNYIYDIVADAGIIYAYNAADFSKSFTKSNYIPLRYGSNKGTKLDNGATMYVVPFKAGKYSVITQFFSNYKPTDFNGYFSINIRAFGEYEEDGEVETLLSQKIGPYGLMYPFSNDKFIFL